MLTLSDAARTTAGVLLLTIVAVEFGGTFLLRIARGHEPATELQRAFFRAGHAHAGVFVTLALVTQVFIDAADLRGAHEAIARQGITSAAILVPGGFFLSVASKGATAPNRLVALVWLGGAGLAAGVVALGVGLLQS